MQRWLGLLAAVLVGGILQACMAAAPGDRPPSAPPTTAPWSAATEPDWNRVLERLGGESFAERQAAQRELDAVGYQQRAFLVDLAQRQTDPEVKARLLGRVDAIDEQLAADPPPISMHVTDASSETVLYKLNQAMGLNLIARHNDTRYTMNMDNAPFWDLYAALSRQDALLLQRESDSAALFYVEPIRKYDRHGGFISYVSQINYNSRIDPQAVPGTEPAAWLTLRCVIATDPRIKVIKASPPHLREVLDDQGNLLLRDDRPIQADNYNGDMQQSMWASTTNLTIPPNPGKKLAVVKGEGRYLVQVSQMERTIDDLQARVKERFNVGRGVVTVERATVAAGTVSLQFTTDPASPSDDATPMHFKVLDADGQQMWDYSYSGSGGIATSISGNHAGPYKLIVTVPDKTREMVVPFELKDIPLP